MENTELKEKKKNKQTKLKWIQGLKSLIDAPRKIIMIKEKKHLKIYLKKIFPKSKEIRLYRRRHML